MPASREPRHSRPSSQRLESPHAEPRTDAERDLERRLRALEHEKKSVWDKPQAKWLAGSCGIVGTVFGVAMGSYGASQSKQPVHCIGGPQIGPPKQFSAADGPTSGASGRKIRGYYASVPQLSGIPTPEPSARRLLPTPKAQRKNKKQSQPERHD